jgi:hypothetical protein
MKLFIDVDARQAVVGVGNSSAIGTITASHEDVLEQDVYFIRAGQLYDVGSSAALRFGLFLVGTTAPSLAQAPNLPPAWVISTAYIAGANVTRTGIQYVCVLANTGQDPATDTPHTYWYPLPSSAWTYITDAAGNYYKTLINFFTSQMVAALASSDSIQCTGEFRYQLSDGEVVHTIYLNFNIFRALVTETVVPPVTLVGTTLDPSVVELKTNKDQPSGYAGLDSSGLILLSEIPFGAGGGSPVLGGQVKTAVAIPTWTHGNTFKVYVTNPTTYPPWVGGGDIATFVSSDGQITYGTVPIDGVGHDGGGYFITVLIEDFYENFFYTGGPSYLYEGWDSRTLPVGALIWFAVGLKTASGSTGLPVVSDPNLISGDFYPGIKGILTTDGSVKVIDTNTDLNFRVSTPAFAGFIPAPAAQAYTVDLAAATTYELVKIYLKVSTGTLTAALNRNGSAVSGASAISVSSTRNSVVLSQIVAIDDLIELVLSSLSGTPLNLAYSVRTQPT